MPIVKMPDGTQVRFPDDMPGDQIKALILSKFPDAGGTPQPPAAAEERPWWASNPNDVGGLVFDAMNAWQDQPAAGEARGQLAPVIRNEGTGALRLGWPQVAYDVASALMLPGEVASGETDFDPRLGLSGQSQETLDRASQLSALTAAELPMSARGMIQSSPRALVNAQTGARIPRLLADDLASGGITPSNLNAALVERGVGSTMGDLTPTLQGRMAKLATMPGPARDAIVDAMNTRRMNAFERVSGEVNRILGPEPIPSQVRGQINEVRKSLSPLYEEAFGNAKAVDTKAIADNLDSLIVNSAGDRRSILQSIRDELNIKGTDQLDPYPRRLHAVRTMLDDLGAEYKGKPVTSVLGDIRKQVDAELAAKVPGIKQVDALYEDQMRQLDAFDYGRGALKAGEEPVHPTDFAKEFERSGGNLVGPSLVPQRISEGMLSKVYEALGVKSNDRVALKQLVTGDGKWNYQKMATAFGDDRARQFVRLLENEARMAETEGLAAGGSKTALMQEGGEGLGPRKPDDMGMIRKALNMDFGDAAFAGINKVTGGAFEAARRARNAEIARALLSQGGDWVPNDVAAALVPRIVGNPTATAAVVSALMEKR